MNRKKIKLSLVLALILLPVSLLDGQIPNGAGAAGSQAPVLLDLDVKDVDIKEIGRIVSRISGLNVVVSDDVTAKVTFKGTNVDWESALSMILKTYNLTSVREGNFLRILTYAKLRQEEEGVPLVNKVVFLNFAKAADMVSALGSIRSNRGRIDVDTKTNSLIITDTPEAINKMLGIITYLDKRTPQVMIEAMMIDVKLTDNEQLGISWNTKQKDVYVPDILGKEVQAISYTQSLSSTGAGGIIRYGKTLLSNATLSATIDFWCKNGKAEVLANPRVLTLDGLTAKIELLEQVPYLQSTIIPSTGGATSTYSFVDTGIKLDVTPHISVGGFVSLDIKTSQSFQSDTANNQPVIDSRTAETNLLVGDGETVVIGGLKKKSDTFNVEKIPIIGDIPLVGRLFQKRVKTSTNSELLIFVTVYIMKENKLTQEEQASLDKFRGEGKEKTLKNISKKSPFPLRAPSGANVEY